MTLMPCDSAVWMNSVKAPRSPEPGIDAVEVGDVVAVVSLSRGEEGHQPDAGDAEPGKVVDAFGQTVEVADAIAVAIEEDLNVKAVNDGVFPPQVDLRFAKHRIILLETRRGL